MKSTVLFPSQIIILPLFHVKIGVDFEYHIIK